MCERPMALWVRAAPGDHKSERKLVRDVRCRRCYICLCVRQNEYVGRCIAESKCSDASRWVHLTYRDDDIATNLSEVSEERKRDVQLWLKRMRKAGEKQGFKVRYLVSAEYGDKYGRLHYHACLFFTGRVPFQVIDGEEVELNGTYQGDTPNNSDPFWPHGRTVWDTLHANSIRYACKYTVKGLDDIADYEAGLSGKFGPEKIAGKRHAITARDASLIARGLIEPDEHWRKPRRPVAAHLRYSNAMGGKGANRARRTWFTVSKVPALGTRYFTQLAEQYVKQGLVPQKPHFWFPEVMRGRDRKTGKYDTTPFVFRLLKGSATMRFWAAELERLWPLLRPGEAMPGSELVEYVRDYNSKLARWRADLPKVKQGGSYYCEQATAAKPPRWPDPVTLPDGETPLAVDGMANPAVASSDRPWFSATTQHWHYRQKGDDGALVWSWDVSGQPGWVPGIVGNLEAETRRKAAIAADKPLWLPKRERVARDKAARAAELLNPTFSGSWWMHPWDDPPQPDGSESGPVERFAEAVQRAWPGATVVGNKAA